MKDYRIILVALCSCILTGCVSKETMDSLTTNWWIALYFVGNIICSYIAARYSNRLAFNIGVISAIGLFGSILYRCGYFH